MAGLSRRALAIAAAGAALAACSRREPVAEPPRSFAPQVAALPPIAAGLGRIAVVRDDWSGGWGEVQVTIDGQPAGAIRDGGVLARDVPPGRHGLDLLTGAVLAKVEVQGIDVDVRPAATTWIRLVHFVGEVKATGFQNNLTPGRSGRGSSLPAMNSGAIASFRFSELDVPPR